MDKQDKMNTDSVKDEPEPVQGETKPVQNEAPPLQDDADKVATNNSDEPKVTTSDPDNQDNQDNPENTNDDEQSPGGQSDEDDVRVTIEDFNFKPMPRQQQQAKPASVDLEASQAILDVDINTLDDKPWRKPGADISDYFNYGFDEDTWILYCERQKEKKSISNELRTYESYPIPVLNEGYQIPVVTAVAPVVAPTIREAPSKRDRPSHHSTSHRPARDMAHSSRQSNRESENRPAREAERSPSSSRDRDRRRREHSRRSRERESSRKRRSRSREDERRSKRHKSSRRR